MAAYERPNLLLATKNPVPEVIRTGFFGAIIELLHCIRARADCGDAVAVSVLLGRRLVFFKTRTGFCACSVGIAMLAVLNSRSTGMDVLSDGCEMESARTADAEMPTMAAMMRAAFMSFSLRLCIRKVVYF
jgi:hypothetical protein